MVHGLPHGPPYHLSRLHTSKFSLTSVIDNVICSCVWKTNFLWQVFPWQVLFAGVNELTHFLWQVFTVASNKITQRTRIKTTTRRQFRFFIMAHAYLTKEKRVLACGLGCALLMQYEHSKRHMNRTWSVRPWATQRRSQSQGFASNLVQELREEDERRFHNFFRSLQDDILKITTTRPQFPYFLWQVPLSTRTDEQILQCDNFFLAKSKLVKENLLVFNRLYTLIALLLLPK